jgi:hypothetical protein
MSILNKFRHFNFSALFLASSIFLILSFNCYASEVDPSMQKYIEKFKNLEITQKDGVKYFDRAKFWEKEGIYITYLEGAPFEMGYQQGKLLKEYIRTNAKYSNMEIEKFGNPESIRKILKNIEIALPKEFIEEIKGIAAGSEVPYDDLFRHNFWTILSALTKQYLCSNFAVFNEATVDKKIVHFTTLDWTWVPSFSLFQIRRPSTGNGFVTASEAGLIQATGFGLNEKGISVGHTGNLNTAKEYYSDEGFGKFMLLRKMLQYANTVDDVEKILNVDKVMEPCIYLVVDGKTKEGKVFEVTSKGFKSRLPKNNFLGSTNHFTLWREPIGKRSDISEDRLRLMERFSKKNYGKIDLNNTITFLRDERIAKIYPQGGIITLGMMLFTPENLDFWVAGSKEENIPAPWGPIVGFNLFKELGKGDRQLPDPVTFPSGRK